MADETEPSTQELTWDISKSAESLVTLASILAAFVFAVLAILLTTPLKPVHDPTIVLELLLPSFFSLVTAAFLFAVLAGEGSAVRRYRPFAEGFFASWILTVATVQLCVSLVWLLYVYGSAEELIHTARLVVYSAVGVTSFSLAGVAFAPLFQHPRRDAGPPVLFWLSMGALPGVSLLSARLVHGLDWSSLIPWLSGFSVALVLVVGLIVGLVESLTEVRVKAFYEDARGAGILFASMLVLAALYTGYLSTMPGSSFICC